MKSKINKPPGLLIIPRLIVGLIFLSEGIQKFVNPAEAGTGRFTKIGFSHPEFWSGFTGSFEITCAVLILPGIAVRFAAIPLLVVMLVAFVSTKWPILVEKGFWPFAHEYRTDFAMTLLLIMLIKYARAKNPSEN